MSNACPVFMTPTVGLWSGVCGEWRKQRKCGSGRQEYGSEGGGTGASRGPAAAAAVGQGRSSVAVDCVEGVSLSALAPLTLPPPTITTTTAAP